MAGGAAILWVFLAVQLYLGFLTWLMPITWIEAFHWAVPDLLLWLLLIPLIIEFSRRFPLTTSRWGPRFAVHLAASGAIAFSTLGLRAGFELLSGWSLGAPWLLTANFFRMGISFPSGMMLYWTVVGVRYALTYYSKFQERDLHASHLETQLVRAQLDALKMQLHPHFLFNTMNAIAVLMRRDIDAATRTLHQLSELLRITLDGSGIQETSIEREMEFLRTYLEIQRTRFQDRLAVLFDIDDDVLGASVPNLILQPLVENAIEHGVSRNAAAGWVRIAARRIDDALEIEITDNGPGIQPSDPEGIGLSNTRGRLHRLYRDQHRFAIEPRPDGGTVARLRFPFRLHEASEPA